MRRVPDRDGGRERAAPDDPTPVDPELESDLGAEFELRGDQLLAELESAREEAATHRETAQRVQADFENFRKRMTRDHADAVKRAGERIVSSLLPVIDNLERAIAHAETEGGETAPHGESTSADTDLLAGVRMVHGQLLDVLAKEGVVVDDPAGQPFDAIRHQAVGQLEDPTVPEGTVVEVYQKGYELHGRTIRSAMVVVSTGGPTSEE